MKNLTSDGYTSSKTKRSHLPYRSYIQSIAGDITHPLTQQRPGALTDPAIRPIGVGVSLFQQELRSPSCSLASCDNEESSRVKSRM